jgi:pyrimidine operon attenuation protein / uracil phosphoribosyltransferase
MTKNNLIFDRNDIRNKVKRLSLQILEDHYNEDEIHLIGVKPGGAILAGLLKESILQVKNINITEHSVSLNKKEPLSAPIELSTALSALENKCVILVDDVANTGKTTFYAMQPLASINLKSLKVAVLVDRMHKKFPVHCDYVGNTLSTTMQEHIEVTYQENHVEGVYLI